MLCEDLTKIIIFRRHKSRFFAIWSPVKGSNTVYTPLTKASGQFEDRLRFPKNQILAGEYDFLTL